MRFLRSAHFVRSGRNDRGWKLTLMLGRKERSNGIAIVRRRRNSVNDKKAERTRLGRIGIKNADGHSPSAL